MQGFKLYLNIVTRKTTIKLYLHTCKENHIPTHRVFKEKSSKNHKFDKIFWHYNEYSMQHCLLKKEKKNNNMAAARDVQLANE